MTVVLNLLTAAALLLGFTHAWAQTGYLPPPPRPPASLPDIFLGPPPSSLSPEAAETIERMLGDLQSEDPELRTGAAMILGKYPNDRTRDALLAALEDPSVRVRRAVTISLLDSEMLRQPFDTLPLLSRIADEDVEVRRSVSARGGLLVSLLRQWSFNRNRTVRAVPDPLPPMIRDQWQAAILDPDPIVRRNLIENFDVLGLRADSEIATRLLTDEDREVRLRALPIISRFLGPVDFAEAARETIDPADTQWCLALTRELSRQPGDAAADPLRLLATHPDSSVANEAAIALFRIHPEDPGGLPVYQALLEGRLSPENAERMVMALLQLPSAIAGPALERVFSAPDAGGRASAARFWLLLSQEAPATATLVRLLEDRDPQVRAEALAHLDSARDRDNTELRDAVLFSPHRDVRGGAFNLLAGAPPETAVEILSELILDQDPSIRQRALYEYIRGGLPGWERVARASLQDRDPGVRAETARFLLMRPDPATAEMLRRYATAHPTDPLAAEILRQLGNRP